MEKRTAKERYNTETAARICEAGGTTLYRKRGGKYFFCDGREIAPASPEEAEAWAREWMSSEEFGRAFVPVGGKIKRGFILAPITIERIAQLAVKRGRSQSEIVEDAINDMWSRADQREEP